MASTNPSLASLARAIERALPPGFEPRFDAETYLRRKPLPGTAVQSGSASMPRGQTPEVTHHPDCPDAPWNQPEARTEHPGQGPLRPSAHEARPEIGPGQPRLAAGSLAEEVEQRVPPLEPAEAGSNSSNQSKKCRALKQSGERCKAYPLIGGDLCVYHDPGYAPRLKDAAVKGGRTSPVRLAAVGLEELSIDLHSRLSFHAFTEAILRMQLAGSIPRAQCALLLRTLQILERNLSSLAMSPAGRDSVGYQQALSAGLESAPVVKELLDTSDMVERANQIADVGARRQEFLKANDQFAPVRNSPARSSSPVSPSFRVSDFAPSLREFA